MYWNRPNLPNRPILSISNLSPRNYDAGLNFMKQKSKMMKPLK